MSEGREYDDVSWQPGVSDFIVDLSWTPSSAIKVYFRQVPAEPLSIHLYAPYLLREVQEANLYLMKSPISEGGEQSLMQNLNKIQIIAVSKKEVRFSKDVDVLINRMAAGNWAMIELKTNSGVVHNVELPSIDFNQSLERFNALRNELPPISWNAARHRNIYFSAGSAILTTQQKRRLDDLVEFVAKDASVTGVTIDAHSDVQGNRLKNLTLSRHRADRVRNYLVNAGMDKSLLKAVRHHGERYPIPGVTPGENRRVEIKLTR